MNGETYNLNFGNLVGSIREIDEQLTAQAGRAVNVSLTIRNWLIGFYIREYEQNGADRAQYGESLLDRLSSELRKRGVSRSEARELRRYRLFYSTYPQIRETLTPESIPWLHLNVNLGDDVSQIELNASSPLSCRSIDLVQKLAFSHFVELIAIDDEVKRVFYEIECIRGNWSVRELKRQINSLYYERSGLSKNKKKLRELTQTGVESVEPSFSIRDPYIFEFLGLKPKEVMSESHLEDQLLDKLQDFLLAMPK